MIASQPCQPGGSRVLTYGTVYLVRVGGSSGEGGTCNITMQAQAMRQRQAWRPPPLLGLCFTLTAGPGSLQESCREYTSLEAFWNYLTQPLGSWASAVPNSDAPSSMPRDALRHPRPVTIGPKFLLFLGTSRFSAEAHFDCTHSGFKTGPDGLEWKGELR